MSESVELAATLAAFSGQIAGTDAPVTLQRVVDVAVRVVPGCDHAGLHLARRRGRAEHVAASDDIATQADELQVALEDGPCVDAAFEGENFVVDDVRADPRWPTWASRVSALGIRSSLSVRLTVAETTIGALNLYSDRVGTFTDDQDVAMIFASHAAAALSNAELVSGLRNALDSRHAIGMAQGVLALRYEIGYESAFQVLRRYSNDHNVKLRDVADLVLEQRGLPGAAGAEGLDPPT